MERPLFVSEEINKMKDLQTEELLTKNSHQKSKVNILECQVEVLKYGESFSSIKELNVELQEQIGSLK